MASERVVGMLSVGPADVMDGVRGQMIGFFSFWAARLCLATPNEGGGRALLPKLAWLLAGMRISLAAASIAGICGAWWQPRLGAAARAVPRFSPAERLSSG